MKLKKLNKKGILGLDTAKQFILFILITSIIGFAAIIALATLDSSSVLPAGSEGANQTTNILNNVSTGIARFFQDATTWFVLLSVVVIILIIGVVVFAVNRFGGAGAGGGL